MVRDSDKEKMKQEIAKEVSEQILESIKNEVIPAVEASIQKTVNGKIDRLTERFDCHAEEMRPLRDGLRVFISLQKFMKFIGVPVLLLLAPFFWALKKML